MSDVMNNPFPPVERSTIPILVHKHSSEILTYGEAAKAISKYIETNSGDQAPAMHHIREIGATCQAREGNIGHSEAMLAESNVNNNE